VPEMMTSAMTSTVSSIARPLHRPTTTCDN